ncbi:integrase [Chromatocurvus halotolerans]|uniref:Integrase n=2 Tax=Chromatocurvus halotolerans TaxID=1132028 RepID=A0A4R2LCT1_9GAMM|nr:integrase [Chromatocurvus halotolerans]
MAFTVKMINGLEPKSSGPYRISDELVPGLNIQISPGGNKAWTLRYRDERGKRKYLKLGQWPALGIAAARDKAREKKTGIANGENPRARPKADASTVKQLIDAYMASKTEAKSYKLMKSYRKKVPAWFEKKLACDVTIDDCHEVLRPIAKATPTMANRVLTYLRTIWNFGIDVEYDLTRDRDLSFGVKDNPLRNIKPISAAERPAEVRLTMENLAAAWTHIPEYNSPVTWLAIRFHIAMYGRRVKDTLYTRWEEIIDVDGITCISLPEGRTKSGKPQIIPLTRHALEVLDEVHDYTSHQECVFPQRTGTKTPLSLIALGAAARKVREDHPEMGDFSPRYCRACAVTELGNYGIDRHLIDLAHQRHIKTVSGIGTKAYDRAHRVRELKVVADAWDEILCDALRGYSDRAIPAVNNHEDWAPTQNKDTIRVQ